GQSYFPRIFCLVNPIVFSFIATLLSKSRRGIWAKIHGAAFNIGNILFYILSLGYILIMWK
ncbi:MAG: hypothetical protein Q4P28_03735, partial [Tissierellia bacterium]|nr:hypothetical protein [Tissierellia bacterium]